MEVTAHLRNVRLGARKGRAVADLVRSRSCSDALSILEASPRGAARPIAKLIRSALANAEEKNARQQARNPQHRTEFIGQIEQSDGNDRCQYGRACRRQNTGRKTKRCEFRQHAGENSAAPDAECP